MDKQQLLSELKQAVTLGIISREEISSVAGVDSLPVDNEVSSVVKKISLPEIFYYIGSIIVFIGLIILVAQNWDLFTYPVRVLITLGAGIAFYVSALLLQRTNIKRVGTAFALISCLLMPVGYIVLLEPNYQSSFVWIAVIVFLLSLVQFGITQFITKKNVFTIFNIIYGTGLFFSLTNALFIGPMFADNMTNFYFYRIIFIGLSYLLIAYYLNSRKMFFGGLVNTFGTLGILGPAFYFNTVLSQSQNIYSIAGLPSSIWTWLFPILVVGVLYLSVRLKNSAFLFWGTLFFIGYIIRVTGSNFVDTIGWPLSIIVVGVVTVALGYLAFFVNKKYIRN